MAAAATQRAEDRLSGYPTGRKLTEDPKKRGIPLFLQTQNRAATFASTRMAPVTTAQGPAPGEAFVARLGVLFPGEDDSGFREFLAGEWRSGRFRDHWLDEPATLSVFAERFERSRIKVAEERARLRVLAAEKAAQPKNPRVPGYKGHLAGSRKGRVHEEFDVNGSAAAVKLAKKLGLQEGTVRSWVKSWGK